MPWQSLYSFKPSTSKRKEQQPATAAPDAPVNTQLTDPYSVHAYAPTPLSAPNPAPSPVPEQHSKPTVTFGAEAYPPR